MEQGAHSALLLFSSLEESNFGNPSSIHWAGQKAKSALDKAREQVAQALGLEDPEEILFTGSATESINTALKGFFFQAQKQNKKLHLITSETEHEATLETAKFLSDMGALVTYLKVNSQGEMNLEELKAALEQSPAESIKLVSLIAANNETGVIFPFNEAAKITKESGGFFHLDAVQALGKIPGFVLDKNIDLASISAHKIGGPKGVGALYIKRGVKLEALLHGGAQERKRRAGTVNLPAIAAFGAAAQALSKRDLAGIDALRKKLESLVKEKISGTHIQGEKTSRIVNTSNFLFDGVRGESLLMGLDLMGFAVSSGSACNSGSILPSHVLLAMGFDKLAAQSAVRVSLGPENTEADIKAFVEGLFKVISRIRATRGS